MRVSINTDSWELDHCHLTFVVKAYVKTLKPISVDVFRKINIFNLTLHWVTSKKCWFLSNKAFIFRSFLYLFLSH